MLVHYILNRRLTFRLLVDTESLRAKDHKNTDREESQVFIVDARCFLPSFIHTDERFECLHLLLLARACSLIGIPYDSEIGSSSLERMLRIKT